MTKTGRRLLGLAAATLVLGTLPAAGQERVLIEHGDLQALVPSAGWCAPEVHVTVRAWDHAHFSGDKYELQRLLGGLRAVLPFECQSFRTLRLIGVVQGEPVYAGHVDETGRLVDQPLVRAPEVAPARPSVLAGEPRNRDRPLVREAQGQLNQLGFDAGPVDGAYGRRTRSAIEAYERSRGLAVRGDVTAPLVESLRAELAGVPRLTPVPSVAAPPTGSTAGSLDFAPVPEPDYVSMLRLYMAANADLLDNDAFAYQHHAIFGITADGDQRLAQRECIGLIETMRNEITRRRFLEEARQRLARDLEQAAFWPETGIFRLVTSRRLEEYDLADQAFPIGRAYSGAARSFDQPIRIARAASERRSGRYYGDSAPWICGPAHVQLPGQTPHEMQFQVHDRDPVSQLPMPMDVAEAYLERYGRTVGLEYIVEVGPYPHGAPAPARLIAARALDPDGRVLHVYDPDLFREPAGDAVMAVADPADTIRIPLARHMLVLTSLEAHPQLLEASTLEYVTSQQVVREQHLWGEIDKHIARLGGASRPLLIYEWQALVDTDSAKAAEVLDNLFLALEPDWSFAERAGDFDPRLEYLEKQAVVFTRDRVVGREPGFAARELEPVMRRLLLEMASRVPRSFQFELPLPQLDYDFERALMTFGEHADRLARERGESGTGPLRAPSRMVFESEAEGASRSMSHLVLPDALRSRALYEYDDRILDRRARRGGQAAHEAWRETLGHYYAPDLLALDRLVTFDPVPLAPALAERWAREQASRNLVARVAIDVEGVELARRRASQRGDLAAPILLARLAGVEIVTGTGEVLLSLAPDAFQRPDDVAAAERAAALDPGQMVAPGLEVRAPASLPFSAEVADLLMARFLPDELDETTIARMLLARRHYEASFDRRPDEPEWGRFFVKGAAMPDAQQLRELAPRFREWTLERARAMPSTVTVGLGTVATSRPGPIHLGAGRPDDMLRMQARQCMTSARAWARQDPALLRTLENACAFLDEALTLVPREVLLARVGADPELLLAHATQDHLRRLPHPLGLPRDSGILLVGPRVHCGVAVEGQDTYCRGGLAALEDELLGQQVRLNDVLVLDQEVVIPDSPQIARLSGVQLELEVEIEGMRRSDRLPPHPVREAFQHYHEFLEQAGIRAQDRVRDEGAEVPVELFLIDARIREARLVDGRSRQPVATLPLQAPRTLDTSLLRAVEPEPVAPPSEPFGPEVAGLRLGMSFEEAERIVREHMSVGRLLVADRAWQAKAATGDIEAYSSGRLFESEDGTELIVLYDEPPAVPGIVVGVVRQLALPKGAVAPAQAHAQLEQRYGPATYSGSENVVWVEGGSERDRPSRFCVPSYNAAADMRIWRDPEGGEVTWQPTTMRYRERTPGLGPLHEPPYTANCPTLLAATFDTRQNRQWDRLILRLLDHGRYRELFEASKGMIERGEAGLDAPEPTGPAVDLRL